MRKLNLLIKLHRRKNSIEATAAEMEDLERVLYDAWKNRGPLNRMQRMTVLKNLVEKIRKESSQDLETSQAKTLEIEQANDISKQISFY